MDEKLKAIREWVANAPENLSSYAERIGTFAESNLDKIDLNKDGEPDFRKLQAEAEKRGGEISEAFTKFKGQGVGFVEKRLPGVGNFLGNNTFGILGTVGALLFAFFTNNISGPVGALLFSAVGFAVGNLLGDKKEGILPKFLHRGNAQAADSGVATDAPALEETIRLDVQAQGKNQQVELTGKYSENRKQFEISTIGVPGPDGNIIKSSLEIPMSVAVDENGLPDPQNKYIKRIHAEARNSINRALESIQNPPAPPAEPVQGETVESTLGAATQGLAPATPASGGVQK